MDDVTALPEEILAEESWTTSRLTDVGRWLDRAALRSMALAFDRTLLNAGEDRGSLLASAEPYVADDLLRDPRRFFSFVDVPATAEPIMSTALGSLPGGTLMAHTFASAYQAYDPRRAERSAELPENAVIPVQHWKHDDGASHPTVIALHGFTMGRPRSDAFVLKVSRWFAAGLDVVLVPLPFHGPRSPRSASYSGELFGSWNVAQLNEAVRQSVHDVHLVASWIRRHGGASVGLIGLSLGGYVATLMAGLRPDYDFVIPIVPAVCLATLPSRLFALSRYARRTPPPLSLVELRAAYRVHSPLSYPLQIPKRRIFIIAGRGDCIVPPGHPHALWRHWGEPEMLWFSGSHFAPFRRTDLVDAGLRHLRGLGVIPEACELRRPEVRERWQPARWAQRFGVFARASERRRAPAGSVACSPSSG